jgi:cytoskeletal protein CcmA (bactofilin family)
VVWRLFDQKHRGAEEWSGFLEQTVKLDGKLEATGTFRIDCALRASLVSADTLILAEHAVAEGRLIANTVLIAGRFDGEIEARTKVEIQRGAIVTGQIQTPCLVIEPGAIFDGHCQMPMLARAGATNAEAPKPIAIPIRSAVAQPQE